MTKYEIILTVCETCNISVTAEKYNYTQSAISQIIKNFEKEIGMPLFQRTKTGLKLVPNTEGIVDALRHICHSEKKIFEISSALTSLDSGYIRIGSVQSIAYHWLTTILKDFSIQYPNIRFEFSVDGSSGIVKKLLKNELDCVFLSSHSLPDSLKFYPLGSDELMLICSHQHPLAKKEAISLEDIRHENYILSVDRFDYETGDAFQEKQFLPSVRYQLNDDFAVQKMVEDGFGITILPSLLLYHTPFQICIRSFKEHYRRTLGVACSNQKELSPATVKFLEYVQLWCKTHPDKLPLHLH